MTLAASTSAATSVSGRGGSRRSRLLLGLVGCLLVLVLLCLVSLAVGTRSVPLPTVADALLHYRPTDTDQVVVVSLRVPRTLLGLLVGAALALAGCVMQGITRNPLADPGILGVNAGAALFVVLAIGVVKISGVGGYVWFAFLGAALAALVVYGAASAGRDGATPIKLALAGAAVTALLGSLTTALLLLDQRTFDQFRFWQVGTLAGRDLEVSVAVLPFVLLGAVLALGLGRSLNSLALGDDVARGLGVRVGLVRAVAAVAVVLLCGAATAAAGPIGFVGLVIPHAVRAIIGPDHRWMLGYALLLGPSLLLAADVLGRVIARPGEVQVAILTAVLGAPVFVALVRRRRLATL